MSDKYYVDPNWCLENAKEAAAELARRRRWFDELVSENAALGQERSRARLEAAKLAAHVERINQHAESCANELATMIDRYNTQNMEDGSWEYDHQTPHDLMMVVRDTPENSLARQKLLWQAEKLEEVTDRAEPRKFPCTAGWPSAVDELRAHAAELRRQAEEKKP